MTQNTEQDRPNLSQITLAIAEDLGTLSKPETFEPGREHWRARMAIEGNVHALVAEVRRLRERVADAASEAVSIAATAVRSQGETDPDISDSTLRSISRRTKALADGLRE